MTEEILNKRFASTAQDELWTTVIAFDVFNKDLQTTADVIIFALDLFALWNNPIGFSDFNTNHSWFNSYNGSVHNGTNLVFVFLKYNFSFSFAEAL